MIVLDVNVLLAAFRGDHSHHARVRPWFEERISSGAELVVPDLVWVGFLRLVTNDHIFGVPSSFEEAYAFQSAVTQSPGYRAVSGLSDDWTAFEQMAVDAHAVGNLISDAYIASVAAVLACPVGTMDRDFRRFRGIEIVDPLTA